MTIGALTRTRSLTLRVRSFVLTAGGPLALIVGVPASAQTDPATIRAAIASTDAGPREIRAFYVARGNRPLWIVDGAIGPAAERLLTLIETSAIDGLDAEDYRPRVLVEALNRSLDGDPKAVARAELLMTRRFAELARDMRRPRETGMVYADATLAPRAPTLRETLDAAGAAPSLDRYLDDLGWMNPVYTRLREAATAHGDTLGGSAEEALVRVNLDRVRALPAGAHGGRYVLVDAAAARLWMYNNGAIEGTMRVVVGKPAEPTPMMAGLIRYASVNPYWNIPPDLVRLRVVAGARARGNAFLAKRYEILSDWTDDAHVIDPSSVDWDAVAAARTDLRVRQLPGPTNAMGRIKFMFPNNLGIYLHDTPEKTLLKEDDRLFSSGCVRVEDAPRLARWLFGRPVPITGGVPERRVDLPGPVPVYITYLTVAADAAGTGLVFRPDVYGRDTTERRYASR